MIVMTKKKGRPRRPRPTEPIQIRVDPALARAIEEMAERNHHSRTQEIILVLEEKLKEEGFWPPKQEGE